MNLTLGLIDDGATVNDVGIGPVETEKIGEVWHRYAFVGIGTVAPNRFQCIALFADNVHWPQKLIGMKSRRKDKHINFV